jgi:branched-subunit amino acid ABC-type transport system permease component
VAAILISGLVTGSLYALLALGLIVIFGSTRMLNFAQGAVGAIGALTATSLTSSSSSPLAIVGVTVLGIMLSALANVVVYVVCVRLIERRGSEPITTMVTTLGASLVIGGVLQLVFGLDSRSFAMFGTASVHLFGIKLPLAGIGIVVSAWLGFAVYALVLKRTALGLKLRMSADNSTLADLSGINPFRFRVAIWAFTGGLSAWAMLLFAAYQNIGTVSLESLVLVAAVAASWGAFRSPTLTIVGAVALGIAVNVVSRYVSITLTATLSAALIIVVFQVRNLLGARQVRLAAGDARTLLVRPWHTARRWVGGLEWTTLAGAGLIVVFLAAVFPAMQIGAIARTGVGLVAFAWSLRFCDKLNLAIPMYMAFGGYLSAILLVGQAPPAVALVVSLGATGCLAVIVRVVTWRIEPMLYIVVTLSLTAAVPELISLFSKWTGGDFGLTVPALFGSGVLLDPRSVAIESTIAVLVVGALFTAVAMSRFGAKTIFVSEHPTLAAGLGLPVRTLNLTNELIVGVIAGSAGVLAVQSAGLITPESFGTDMAVYYLLAVVIGGGWTLAGVVAGAVVLVLVPEWTTSLSPTAPNILYGAGLILFVLFFGSGVEGALTSLYRLGGARPRLSTLEGSHVPN